MCSLSVLFFFFLSVIPYTPWRRKWQPTPVLTLAWKIPWMEEPCRLQSMGSYKSLFLSFFLFSYWFLTELSVVRASHFWLYPYTEPASTLTLLIPSKTSHWHLKLWGFFCSYLFLIWLEPDYGSFLDLVGYLPTLSSSYFL